MDALHALHALHALLKDVSWMSPPLGLASVAALVIALAYAVVAAQPLRALPLYWLLGMAGFAAGQAIALKGPRWLPLGDLALGTGAAACTVLYTTLYLLRLWYTGGRRPRLRVRSTPLRRERLQ